MTIGINEQNWLIFTNSHTGKYWKKNHLCRERERETYIPRLNGYLVNTCTTVTQWLLDWGMLGNLLEVESSMRGEEGHSSGQVKYEATGYSRTFPGFTLWLKNAICCQKRACFSSRWHFWYTCMVNDVFV